MRTKQQASRIYGSTVSEPLAHDDIDSHEQVEKVLAKKDITEARPWPNLYEEAMSMLHTSLLVYGLADLRALERKGGLTGGDPSVRQKLLDLPVSAQQVFHVYSENAKPLNASFGEIDSDLYGSAILSALTTSSLTGGVEPEREVVVFDDENSDKELVYGIAIQR